MTLQEAQDFVKNTKYIAWSEDESRQLQEKLFEIGCEWTSTELKVNHVDCPFLLVNDDLKLKYADKNSYGIFENPNNVYISTDDILNIELETEEPKPKFDPNTLQSFDKVLVRSEENEKRKCSFFSHIDKDKDYYKYECVGSSYRCCIPYNEETKHLKGTIKDAPEFYKLD